MLYKKSIIVVLLSGLTLVACDQSSKEKLEEEKAKLEETLTETQTKLDDIKAQLAEFDTTKVETYPKVDVALVQQQIFEHYFETQGTLESENTSVLTPENGGKVVSLHVSAGDKVAKGDPIASFDQSVIQSNIKEVEKNLELAKYMYEKQQALFDQGVGTELQLKQAKTQYEALKQTRESLNVQAGKFMLRAPYSGFIDDVMVVLGDVASPMTPIVRLVNTDKLKVSSDISEVYLKNLGDDTKANIIFPAIDDTVKNAKITHKGRFINPANRTINIEVEVPSNPIYIPNLMTVLQIRDFIDTAALVVPTPAILEDNKGDAFMFVVGKDNIAQKKLVNVGLSYKGYSAITSGVEANDKVVVRGARKLIDGQKIEIENQK